MNEGVYLPAPTSHGSTRHNYPREDITCHLAVGSGITPTAGAGTFPHQAQPFPDERRTHPSLLHVPVYARVPRTSAEEYSAGCNASMWSTDEGPMKQCPGYPAPYDAGVPVIRHPSDSLPRMAFNSSAPAASHVPLNSTLPGSGCFAPGTVMANGEPIYSIHVDTNWREDDVPKNVPSYMGHQYGSSITHSPSFRSKSSGSDSYASPTALLRGQSSPTFVVPIAPEFPTPLTLQGSPCNSLMTQYEDQRVSRDIPQQFPQTSKEPAPLSLSRGPASSDRSPGARQALKGSYSCKECDKEYSQPQGLSRHRREIHEPNLCTFCGAFKWGRRYLLREHLKKKHPELDTDSALDEATGAHHGAIVGSRGSTGQQVPLSAAEHHRWGCGGSPFEASLTKGQMGAQRPLLRVGAAQVVV